MAYTQQEFEKIVEAVSEELAAVIDEKLKGVTTDLHKSFIVLGEWLAQRQQETSTNPLAFYETILKIRSSSSPTEAKALPERPYFADVFNDVVLYFGGTETSEPQGKQFLAEAKKRFAYLLLPGYADKTCLAPNGFMAKFDLRPGVQVRVVNNTIIDSDKYISYTQHEFDVLRQLLENMLKEKEEQKTEEESIEKTKELEEYPKKIISSDLADMLNREK